MLSKHAESTPDLDRHILFLGRIYTFLGWLGLLGSAILLLSIFSGPQVEGNAGQVTEAGIFQALQIFLLICWSILLLNFSKDITGKRKWSTGIAGLCIGFLNLLSVPVGTAVGCYTLWILFMQQRLHHQRTQ
jgi:hypothetical protein